MLEKTTAADRKVAMEFTNPRYDPTQTPHCWIPRWKCEAVAKSLPGPGTRRANADITENSAATTAAVPPMPIPGTKTPRRRMLPSRSLLVLPRRWSRHYRRTGRGGLVPSDLTPVSKEKALLAARGRDRADTRTCHNPCVFPGSSRMGGRASASTPTRCYR